MAYNNIGAELSHKILRFLQHQYHLRQDVDDHDLSWVWIWFIGLYDDIDDIDDVDALFFGKKTHSENYTRDINQQRHDEDCHERPQLQFRLDFPPEACALRRQEAKSAHANVPLLQLLSPTLRRELEFARNSGPMEKLDFINELPGFQILFALVV